MSQLFFLLDQSSSWIKYECEKSQRKKFSISIFYFCRKLDWCNEFVKFAKGCAANLFIFLFSLKLALWTQVNMYPKKKKTQVLLKFFFDTFDYKSFLSTTDSLMTFDAVATFLGVFFFFLSFLPKLSDFLEYHVLAKKFSRDAASPSTMMNLCYK